jgi:uncharacterized protein YqgQ
LETVNEFTKDRREYIESMDDEIKQVKDKIINAKQGWISIRMVIHHVSDRIERSFGFRLVS